VASRGRRGEQSGRRRRLRGIEGLRAAAAVSVLVYHVWLYGAPGGHSVDLGPLTKLADNLRAGVTLFFVLSGFLLFRPYVAAAWNREATPSARQYFLNRLLRILPAYWTILVVVALAFEPGLAARPLQLLANASFLQNYVPSYALGEGIVPAWSLSIEMTFYLLVPVLGGLALALARRRGAGVLSAALAPVVLMALVGLAAKAAGHALPAGAQGTWGLTILTHADWFAAGMAVAVAHVRREALGGRGSQPALLGSLAGAVALSAVSVELYYRGTLSYVEYQTPIAIACALLLALVVFADDRSRLLRILESRPLVLTGLGSYSLFLWHDPLLRTLRSDGLTMPGTGGLAVNLLLVASIAGAASTLTYLVVERPALRLKRAWYGRGRDPVPAEPVGTLDPAELAPAAQI
jgi:peptidoglycan/LPS O-acetylase OafA/YrhL